MSEEENKGFLLNCFKKNNLSIQNSSELSGFGVNNIKGMLKSNKVKWIIIGVSAYIIITKFGLINVFKRKGK